MPAGQHDPTAVRPAGELTDALRAKPDGVLIISIGGSRALPKLALDIGSFEE
jgi:hypothetical protein